MSSEFRPGGPLASTPELPVFVAKDGIHCQDLYMNDPTPEILELRVEQIKQMKSWIDDYYGGASPTSTAKDSPTDVPSYPATTTTLSRSDATLSSIAMTSNSSPTATSRYSTTIPASTREAVPPTVTSQSYSIPSITYIMPSRSVIVG